MTTITGTKRRIAALLVATMVAASAAFAASAATADDAYAVLSQYNEGHPDV